MQLSKSFANFGPENQRKASTHTRAQRRSSLDTFVIPGRTRLPSSKASAFDLQVTQTLLDSSLIRSPRRNMLSAEALEWSPESSPAGCIPRRGTNPGPSDPSHHRVRTDIVRRPPPRFGGREVIIVPPQRPRPHVHQPVTQSLAPIPSQEHAEVQTYDGADDSVTESRFTSTTWSTVSHRIVSDSSGSSRTMGASYYRDEYNKLAEKHKLPRLEAAPDGTSPGSIIMLADIWGHQDQENHTQTKTTTKSHHPGWLARKLFRRSTSTYTLKARTTYKPIVKKKSFAGIAVLSQDSHKNTLKGKSLEELSRLGGLSVFILPSEFAVDKLPLPTCLSATATYLYQHGCNAPGIFRVSGQTTIVNALYDFYDHQFSNADAGSPSKVEQTVGSGLLPSHIEHTVPDVASFFKRVLIDLPGGLLGSVELFEAIQNVMTNLEHDPELSEPDLAKLKAKMIALAISSVASDYRLYLIQAVLGLVSYLGHEAEKLQTETASSDEDHPSSELMSYRSLGVVLGPLLLGNLTDSAVHGNGEGHAGTPRISLEIDSAKKFRKHKRKQSDMKLDQSATLAAFVDRANRTAVVMQQLLSSWPQVVTQLRDINSTTTSSLMSESKTRHKKRPSRTGSRLTMNTSEEDMKFLDILRGRSLPEDIRGAVKVKSNIRMTSRSPMSRGAIDPSEDDNPNDTWLPAASEENSSPHLDHTRDAACAAQDNKLTDNAKLNSVEGTNTVHTEDIGLDVEHRTQSDIAMDKMAMGTILPPLQMKSRSSSPRGFLRLIDPDTETPRRAYHSNSSYKTPETALRDAPPTKYSHESNDYQLQISMAKPLPPIRDAQRAELSFISTEDDNLEPPSRTFARHEHSDSSPRNTSSERSSKTSFSSPKNRQLAERTISPSRQSGQWPASPTMQADEKAMFPPRQSSLPMEQHLTVKPLETYASLAEYKAKADTYMSPPKFNVSPNANEAQREQNAVPAGGPKANNVKFLAQKFAEASRVMRSNNEQAKDTDIPRIYAFVKSLPSPKSPMLGLEDPFFCADSNNASRESLIPKPIREVGRSRESRTISPPKRAAPKIHAKRHSGFGIVTDRDAEIVKKNTVSSPPATPRGGEGEVYDEMVANSNGIGFSKQPLTQLLDAYHHQRSSESLRRIQNLQGSSHEKRRAHNRTVSFAELARPVSPSRSDYRTLDVYANLKDLKDSPIRSNSYLNASDALKPLERHTSINATMFAKICDLQRRLQQMGEEKEAKDRRIEALQEVQGVNPVPAGVQAKGSFGKGGLHNEVRKAKREMSMWKMRAELAERRLAGLKHLSDRSWESERGYPDDAESTERSNVFKKQGDGKDLGVGWDVQGDSPDSWKRRAIVAESQLAQMSKRDSADKDTDVHDLQGDSPDSWKRRAIVAESQLAQIGPLMERGPSNEMVRTTPSPLTAKVYVAVQRNSGAKEESSWNFREEETEGLLNSSEDNESNSEKEMAGRSRMMGMGGESGGR